MHFTIEHEQEDVGRWLAEVPELPGVLAYGATREEAILKAEALALRVRAERLERGEGDQRRTEVTSRIEVPHSSMRIRRGETAHNC